MRKAFSSANYWIIDILFMSWTASGSESFCNQMDVLSIALVGLGSAVVAQSSEKYLTQSKLDACIAKANQP